MKPDKPIYNWRPEPAESKEMNLRYPAAQPAIQFPPELIIPNVASPLNQGNLGACTAHGIIGNYLTGEKKLGLPEWMPSRLGLYYDERAREGTVTEDAGAIIKDGIKVANQVGLAPEDLWPYDISKFTQQPPQEYYDAAKKNRIKFYAEIDNSNIRNIKLPIYHGNPVTFGFQVYKDFESYTDGVLQVPSFFERSLGGHCVYYYGYSDSRQAVLCMNSWGSDWGIGGSFWMSYEYIMSNLCSDLWVIRLQ